MTRNALTLALRGCVVILLIDGIVRADETSREVDVAALVREVRHAEQWIDTAPSFRIRLDGKWIRSPKAIEARRAQLKKQFPTTNVSEANFPELRAETTETVELAFDRRRLFKRNESSQDSRLLDVRSWDGHRATIYEKYTSEEHYAYDREPARFIGQFFMSELPWLRAGSHEYWWESTDRRPGDDFWGYAENFRLTGKETVHGHECYVLENDSYYRTFYVGVTDHRLYGNANRVFPRGSNLNKAQKQAETEIATENGAELSKTFGFYDWKRTLPAAKQREVDQAYFHRLRPLSKPQFSNWLDDYHEAAAGCWVPMSQSYDCWSDDGTFITGTRQLKVTSVSVGEPLPDDLFQLEMKDGVEVNDWGHDPPLFYKFKKDRTAAEWEAIIAEARQQKQDELARTAAQDSAVGKPAPEFPQEHWLNSKPLKWSDLKGKVVVLDFWAEWCGPCRNDLPAAVEAHKDRDTSGIVIIGVHPPGSEEQEITKVMKEFGMEYPVCIDNSPGERDRGWGAMYSRFGVMAIPHAALVDGEGKVVAHGSLREMLAKARELTGAGL